MTRGYCYGCNSGNAELVDSDIPKITQCRRCRGAYRARMAESNKQIAIREKTRDKSEV